MMKKYFSYKYAKIMALCTALNVSKGTDKLMIHTSNGIYMGNFKEPIVYNDFSFQSNDTISTIAHKSYQSLIQEDNFSKNPVEIISENPISIELENVTLFCSNQKISMPSVEIFVDQIIGFSIGSAE